MAISENYEKYNIQQVQSTGCSAVTQAESAPAATVDVTQSESQDTLNTSTSTNTTTNSNITKKQLDTRIATIFNKYGADWNIIKNEGKNIINELGYHFNFQISDTIPEKIAQKILKGFEALILNVKENNQEINAVNLLKAFRKQADMNILKKNNVTEEELNSEEFKKAKGGLRKVLGLSEDAEITPEVIKAYLKPKIEEAVNRLKGITDPEEIKRIQEEESIKQKKLFAVCLVNTAEKDRAAFLNAIEDMFAENRGDFLEDLLKALPEEERIKLGKRLNYAKQKEIMRKHDAFGKCVSKDGCTAITARVAEIQDAETIQKNHEAMVEEAKEFMAKDEVKAVLEKIKKGKELTAQETEIAEKINFYIGYQAGEQVGTANGYYIEPEEIKNLLKSMNYDAYQLPTYTEVLSHINSYVEKHPENLTMAKEDFHKLMDEVTETNYSKVLTGSTENLTEPQKPVVNTQAQETSTTVALGFQNTEKVDLLRPQISKEELYVQSRNIESKEETTSETANFGTKEGCKQYKKENGKVEFIKAAFTQAKNSQMAINEAVSSFKRFNTSMQTMTLRLVNNFGLTNLLPETSESTLKRLKGETFSNYYATKRVNEAAEDIEKQSI